MVEVRWQVTDPRNNVHRVTSDKDVLAIWYHLSPADPLRGFALPHTGRGALDVAAAKERHARNLFERGVRPGGLLNLNKKLHPDAKVRLRYQIERFFGGHNSGRVAVLEEGMDWNEVGTNVRDSQMVKVLEAPTASVAHLFSIPLALLGNTGPNNASTAALISLWTRTGCRSWLSGIECAATDKLLPEDAKAAGLAVRFDVGELTRLDEKDRAEMRAKLVVAGIASPNEIRARENMPPKCPFENGDMRVGVAHVGPTWVGCGPRRTERARLLSSAGAIRPI